MKTITTTQKPAAGKHAASKKATDASKTRAPQPSRKTESITLGIPREDLEVFTAFADHFGLSPEMVMESGLMGQLGAMGDNALSSLASFDERPPVGDPVQVTLQFIPEAHTLLVFAASIVRRPVEELAVNLLRDDALCYFGEMEAAEKAGGLDNHRELNSWARRVINAEFEARRGRMVRESNGFDNWTWLHLERYRPTRFQLSSKTVIAGGLP